MNNYNDFEVKDWLEDTRFRNWVYRGDSDHFWKNFVVNTPAQFENIEQARNILLSVRGELDTISESEVVFRISELMNSISEEDKNDRNPWWTGKWLQVAAIVLLTAGFASYYWKKFSPVEQPYYTMLKRADLAMNEVVNRDNDIQLVNLPDGSSVVLKRNARISYPREFAQNKREVYLLGEAFFEVEKNADQPFFVYAGEMMTRVTGTSFSLKANDKEENVSLVVKTGVVEVAALDVDAKTISTYRKGKTVLTPNHLATLNRSSLEINHKDVENPVLINLSIESQDFSFKRTPLKDAFKLLEMTYGIKINFDKKITSGCTITAKLGDEPVYEKLELICAAVNARFESRNGIITVFSNGCK